VPQINLKT